MRRSLLSESGCVTIEHGCRHPIRVRPPCRLNTRSSACFFLHPAFQSVLIRLGSTALTMAQTVRSFLCGSMFPHERPVQLKHVIVLRQGRWHWHFQGAKSTDSFLVASFGSLRRNEGEFQSIVWCKVYDRDIHFVVARFRLLNINWSSDSNSECIVMLVS